MRRGPEPPLILRRVTSPTEPFPEGRSGSPKLRVLPATSRTREALLPPESSPPVSLWSQSHASSVSSSRLRPAELPFLPLRGARLDFLPPLAPASFPFSHISRLN